MSFHSRRRLRLVSIVTAVVPMGIVSFAVASAREAPSSGSPSPSPSPSPSSSSAPAAPPLPPPLSVDVVPPRAMTIDEALSFARVHQPTLRRALMRVAAAASARDVVRAAWRPTFDATVQAIEGTTNNSTASYLGVQDVDLPRIGGTRVSATGGFAPSTSTLAALGATQEIFDFGRIAAQAAAADVAYEAERDHADAERLDVDLVVRESYYGVLGARAVLRAAIDARQRAGVHRDMAAAGVRTGLAAPVELTRVEADVARFEVARIRAAGSVRVAQAVFAAAVGVPDGLLDVGGTQPAATAVPPLASALEQARARDPVMHEADARVRAADATTRAIAASTRPDLALTATVSDRVGTATPNGGTGGAERGPVPTVANWDVGLVVRWPIYDPVVAARRDSAAARADVARADASVVAAREDSAVQRGYVAFQVSEAVLASLEGAWRAALANYAQAEARFKAGLGTSLEIADAEAVRTDAEIQLAVGQFDAARARAALARLTARDL